MINDTIKNKYIVCKSPEHGKRIIEFFVKNGAVNENNFTGIGTSYFVSQENGIILHEHYPNHYTEMQLPEEFEQKRWDVVDLTSIDEKWDYSEDGMSFQACEGYKFTVSEDGKTVQLIKQTITKAEAEKLLGKTIEG